MNDNQTKSEDEVVDKTTTDAPSSESTTNTTTEETDTFTSEFEEALQAEVDAITASEDDLTTNANTTVYGPIIVKDEFSATNSTIITDKGNTFTVSDGATANISLNNNIITNGDPMSVLLFASNGTATLNLIKQVAEGDILLDNMSTLNLVLGESSYYMGAINSGDVSKSVSVSIDETSQLILAGDSYISALDNKDTTNMNIFSNGHKLFVNGEEVAINGSEAPTLPEVVIEEKETKEETVEPASEETTGTESSNTSNLVPFIVGGAAILLIIVAIIAIAIHNKKKNGPTTPPSIDGMNGGTPDGRPDFSQFDDGPVEHGEGYYKEEPMTTPPPTPAAPQAPSQQTYRPTPPPSESHRPLVGRM